jgi:hypothetical protein
MEIQRRLTDQRVAISLVAIDVACTAALAWFCLCKSDHYNEIPASISPSKAH